MSRVAAIGDREPLRALPPALVRPIPEAAPEGSSPEEILGDQDNDQALADYDRENGC